MRKQGAFFLQQFDYGRYVFLFGFPEAVPPLAEFIRVFDFSFHIGNMAVKEYLSTLYRQCRDGPVWGGCGVTSFPAG
jgi:hypothetical protein